MKLIVDLGDLLKTKNVDLVVLNDSPLLLAFNIIRDGIILKADEKKRVNFETLTMSRYYDEQYYIERHMKRTIERMAKGRLK
jgi:predicted nucleotidyltransferase